MADRLKAALSDTDILIHLASGDQLDILDKLFDKIVIPWAVYNDELPRKAKDQLDKIKSYINSTSSVCEVINRENDTALNVAALPIISDKRIFCGKGESECAGYAYAMNIPIIISDNTRDYRHFPEYIMINYIDLLSINIEHKFIEYEEAEKIFNIINNKLEYPTGKTFDRLYSDAIKRFIDNGWCKTLGM